MHEDAWDACRIEIFRDGLQCVPAAAHENDIGAFRRETPGGRRTDARTCARDEDGFARKTLHDLGLSPNSRIPSASAGGRLANQSFLPRTDFRVALFITST